MLNFQFGTRSDFFKADVSTSYFDEEGEQVCRVLIDEGVKKYKTCRNIIEAINNPETTLKIMCNKNLGNYYDDENNIVWFDREAKRLPRLVDESKLKIYTIGSLVCLFHELGHAKQFYENPIWFRSIASQKDDMGVCYLIEYDNLHRHEDPLLREMNIPIRKRYEFFLDEATAKQKLQDLRSRRLSV